MGLDVSSDETDSRVAVVTYSTVPHAALHLDSSYDKDTVLDGISNLNFVGKSTATGAALDLVRTSILQTSRGYRNGETAIVIITDGQTLEEPEVFHAAVDALHAMGVQVYAFGVGEVNDEELLVLATHANNVFHVSNFDELASEKFATNTLEAVACDMCNYKNIDLTFILDASGSIVSSKFDQIKQFAAHIVSYLIVGESDSRIAAIRFSTGAKVVMELTDSYNSDDIANAILNIARVGASTATGVALDLFSDHVTTPSFGHRSDAELVTILITDGQTLETYDEFLPAVERFHATGVRSFVFGIGRRINVNELAVIASEPTQSHVFLVDDFSTFEM